MARVAPTATTTEAPMKSRFFRTASFLAGQVSGEQPQSPLPQPQLPSLQVQLGPQLHAAMDLCAAADNNSSATGGGSGRGKARRCSWGRLCAAACSNSSGGSGGRGRGSARRRHAVAARRYWRATRPPRPAVGADGRLGGWLHTVSSGSSGWMGWLQDGRPARCQPRPHPDAQPSLRQGSRAASRGRIQSAALDAADDERGGSDARCRPGGPG